MHQEFENDFNLFFKIGFPAYFLNNAIKHHLSKYHCQSNQHQKVKKGQSFLYFGERTGSV